MIDEAHRHGKRTGCHSFGGEGLRNSVIHGCDSIEHGYSLTQELCTMMAQKGLYYDPTLVRYTEPYMDDNDAKNTGGKFRMIPIFEKNARMCIATKGVKTVLGTGAEGTTYAHGTQGLEFVALVKQGGMTTVGALQAGTINCRRIAAVEKLCRVDHQRQVRRHRRGVRQPADRHHRDTTREIRDEGRRGLQERFDARDDRGGAQQIRNTEAQRKEDSSLCLIVSLWFVK